MKNKGIEIYVHIPFCARKCDYCDFTSFVCTKDIQKHYFDALKKQIRTKAETVGRLPVVSVFFGGGTPSVPDAYFVTSTLDTVRECFDVQKDAEITIEVNPNSAGLEKLSAYRTSGFNRLSIGLQSSDNSELKVMSRLHTFEEFLETYNDAKRAGFCNINVDIMSALPGQTVESYKKTLEKVVSLNPEHISAYSLIIEEGTPFFERYKDGIGLPDEDSEREMYYETARILSAGGYHRYEISNYAREGFECLHNRGYWTRFPYLGFGISAASFFDGQRYLCNVSLDDFINGNFFEEREVLTDEDAMEEFMFLGLRLTEGISKQEFFERFNKKYDDVYGEVTGKLSDEGLIKVSEDNVRLTLKGLDVSNYAMAFFLFDSD